MYKVLLIKLSSNVWVMAVEKPSIDPRGRSKVTADSDHCYHNVRLSFQNLRSGRVDPLIAHNHV